MAISQDERLNVRRRLFNIYLHFGHNFERKDMESLVENVRHEEIFLEFRHPVYHTDTG